MRTVDRKAFAEPYNIHAEKTLSGDLHLVKQKDSHICERRKQVPTTEKNLSLKPPDLNLVDYPHAFLCGSTHKKADIRTSLIRRSSGVNARGEGVCKHNRFIVENELSLFSCWDLLVNFDSK